MAAADRAATRAPSHPCLQLDVTAGNTAWSRRAIKEATGAAQGAAYVIRTDTEGNADASCARIKDGEAVVGNYQAV